MERVGVGCVVMLCLIVQVELTGVNVRTHLESTRLYLRRRQIASVEKENGRCGKVRSRRTFPWRYTHASDASTRRHSSPRPKVN